MTPDQYREALRRLSLTQGKAAALLGVDARTSRKWANGEREVPPTANRFLRYLIATGASIDDVLILLTEDETP